MLTRHQATSRSAPVVGVPLSIHKFGPFAVYLIITLVAYPFYRFLVGPDAISYISIAQHYIHGEWSEALNPYWSPLMSWLIAPLLAIGIPGLTTAKIVCILSGLGVLWSLRRIIHVFDLSPFFESATLYTAALMLPSFVLVWITPDLLAAVIVLYYLSVVLSPDYLHRTRAGLLCGAVGVIGYLAKAYNFYFFLVHFTLVSAILWMRDKGPQRARIVRHFAAGFIVFLLGCAPWIAIVSARSSSLTISTASDWNHRLVGPNSPGFPQFYRLMSPSGPHALSMWENPSPSLLPPWSPLASVGNLKHQARLTATNLRGLLEIVNHVSLLGFAALFAYLVWGLSRAGTNRSLWLLMLVSIAITPAGYMLVTLRDRYTWDDRYLWAGLLLVMLAGFVVIHAIDRSLTWLARNVAVTIYALSFVAAPLLDLVRTRNIGRSLYTTSMALKPVIPVGSRLASCGQWNDGIVVAYYLNARFYGSTGITADEEEFRSILNPNRYPAGIPEQMTPDEIVQSLRGNRINYLLVWPDCKVQPTPDTLGERIDVAEQPNLKLYRLSD